MKTRKAGLIALCFSGLFLTACSCQCGNCFAQSCYDNSFMQACTCPTSGQSTMESMRNRAGNFRPLTKDDYSYTYSGLRFYQTGSAIYEEKQYFVEIVDLKVHWNIDLILLTNYSTSTTILNSSGVPIICGKSNPIEIGYGIYNKYKNSTNLTIIMEEFGYVRV